jgi:hypothetical protein
MSTATSTTATELEPFSSNGSEAIPQHPCEGVKDGRNSNSDEEKGSTKPLSANSDDYPHGVTLFFLTLSLVLGMFMMALDNVC